MKANELVIETKSKNTIPFFKSSLVQSFPERSEASRQ